MASPKEYLRKQGHEHSLGFVQDLSGISLGFVSSRNVKSVSPDVHCLVQFEAAAFQRGLDMAAPDLFGICLAPKRKIPKYDRERLWFPQTRISGGENMNINLDLSRIRL